VRDVVFDRPLCRLEVIRRISGERRGGSGGPLASDFSGTNR
jgi:hypothetical protein